MQDLLLYFSLMLMSGGTVLTEGVYRRVIDNGEADVLVINSRTDMSISLTRQVGGPGLLSDDEIVPYPTVCRVRQVGKIISEDKNAITYKVESVTLNTKTEEKDINCSFYVDAFNRMAKEGNIQLTENKQGYTKR